jgi:hypothetical protein
MSGQFFFSEKLKCAVPLHVNGIPEVAVRVSSNRIAYDDVRQVHAFHVFSTWYASTAISRSQSPRRHVERIWATKFDLIG